MPIEDTKRSDELLNMFLSCSPESMFKEYTLDSKYEYKQLEISGIVIEIMRQSPECPRTKAMLKFVEETLPEEGWEMLEIVQVEKLVQIRRYKRLKTV